MPCLHIQRLVTITRNTAICARHEELSLALLAVVDVVAVMVVVVAGMSNLTEIAEYSRTRCDSSPSNVHKGLTRKYVT